MIASFAELRGRTPGVVRRGLITCVALVMAGGAAFAQAPAGAPQNNRAPLGQNAPQPPMPSFADLAERLLPAVVNVSTTQTLRQPGPQAPGGRRGPDVPQFPPGSPFEEFFREFFDRQRPDAPPRRAQSLGSGFIVDSAGFIVTNNHVIAEADEIKVTLHDNEQLTAKVVGRDTKTDLALLKVESPKPLPFVRLGDSDKARVGDWVITIGNPFGLGGTVTTGIISARQRDINAGPYDDFIQTDASINRGNSGGPMFNLAGEVIGINTAIYSPSGGSVGIGFAIPTALAKPVLDQLRQFGKARRGWIGVNIQSVTDEIAESLGLDKARGALVARVSDGGPAEKAKIQAGDVILKFDGHDVTEMRRLPRLVAETPVDKTVPLVVWRKGKEVTVPVKVGELEEAEQVAAVPNDTGRNAPGPATPTVDTLGMSLAPLSQELRERFEINDRTRGVVITRVEDGSPAAERGLRPGEVIVEVNQEAVNSPQQVADKVTQAKTQGRRGVLVMVDRQGEQRFVGLSVDKN